jgi:bifunctional UDP-N-acetylglucosamine pyrophosphorylase/glucosamine-1-phosphate N-acetyltransferase
MSERTCLIVLAAGEGTRMASRVPKVLHRIGAETLIGHVLSAAAAVNPARIAVVIAPGEAEVAAEVRRRVPKAKIFVQRNRRGTAHAVLTAKSAIKRGDDVLVVYGDTPLVRPQTLVVMRDALRHAPVAVLGFRAADPTGYGRLIVEGARLVAVREEKEASPAERAIRLCNAGIMAFSGKHALNLLGRVRNKNIKGEFYLTDAVGIAVEQGLSATVREAPEEEVMGVNDRMQLAAAEAILQARLRAQAQAAGATLIAPDTVFLAADTKLARDVVVEPYVVFGPNVTVEEGAVIRAFSHVEGARIGKGASVGPFARLRPGTTLGKKAKVGNFVEVKAAAIEAGAKANHLAYIGDARVGEEANIGAGTIFCNYDGVAKHRSDVGKGAFIGSNSALVAPVKIGAGAYVGSGSVITLDVPANALAVARGRQKTRRGWAKKLIAQKKRQKHGKGAKDED